MTKKKNDDDLKEWENLYIYEVKYPDLTPESLIYIHMDTGQKVKMAAQDLIDMLTQEQARQMVMSLYVDGAFRLEAPDGHWADITVEPRLN